MCEDRFYTFQAFYIYVKKTRFTIIRKSKRSIRIILNYERSAFTRTGLSFWNLRSSLRAANDERHLTVVERVHHGLFLGSHHGWIHEEILSLKTWKWWRELVFFRRCHRWAGQCVWYGHVHVYRSEWSHSCCDVGKMPFAFSQHWGFHNFVWILHWRVVVVLPRQLHRNRQGIVRLGGLWPSQYLSVQRLLSLACSLLSF